MFVLLLLHLLIGVAIVSIGDRLGRVAFALGGVAPLASIIWAATQWSTVVGDGDGGRPVTESVGWVSGLALDLDLRLDAFALVMTLLVSGIGVLVFAYALGYFSHLAPGQTRLAGLMTLFAGSMSGVVWSDHLIALFVAWELTSITSYLLIGNDDRNPRARAAALQAIFITGGGGLALLAGLVVIGQSAGTYRISELIERPPSGGAVTAGLVCVLLGALTKSAQAPFGSWLPGAMVAPTPISTYLHSATMVKAGVYLVARMSPVVAAAVDDLGMWRGVVLTVGGATMLIGGLRALRQNDLKLLLAYGTVSQLGFMMLLFGTGEYKIAEAGVLVLLAHGAFKATLFMLVGVIDHETGTRDIRRLRRLGRGWVPVKVIAVVAAASMAGVPPLLGFVAKEKGLDTYLEDGDFTGATVVLVVVVIGSVLTFAYSARFVLGIVGAFCGRGPSGGLASPDPDATIIDTDDAPAAGFVAPAAVLAAATVLCGLAPTLISDLTTSATIALDPEASPSAVHLWAGFNTAFVLSLVIIVSGVALTVARRRVGRAQAAIGRRLHRVPSTDDGFRATIRGIDVVSSRVTRVVQSGSLPVYLLVILTTVITVSVVPVIGELDALPQWVEHPIQIPLVAVILAAALASALIKRRIAAVVMLGTVGFAMAGLYEARGAPDLALTQFAVETLGTVLFVLVLRFLPSRFVDLAPAVVRPLRLAVSVVVAAGVFVLALASSAGRSDVSADSVSVEMVERAKPDGEGKNVVNVILVDFRGVDTMGEITVLVVAAVGAVAVARSGRRRDDDDDPFTIGDAPNDRSAAPAAVASVDTGGTQR